MFPIYPLFCLSAVVTLHLLPVRDSYCHSFSPTVTILTLTGLLVQDWLKFIDRVQTTLLYDLVVDMGISLVLSQEILTVVLGVARMPRLLRRFFISHLPTLTLAVFLLLSLSRAVALHIGIHRV